MRESKTKEAQPEVVASRSGKLLKVKEKQESM
jgi:hypothetical protein